MNLKYVLAMMLAVVMMLSLCACGGFDVVPDVTTEPTTEITEPTTEATEPTTESAKPTYVVTVIDDNGDPVVDAYVQLCLESCVPAKTDVNGVANFFLEENDYKVTFAVLPEGYEYAGEEETWYFAEGENTMTIILKKSV